MRAPAARAWVAELIAVGTSWPTPASTSARPRTARMADSVAARVSSAVSV